MEVYLLNNNRITGMMIYYYFVCKRKLWYFVNELTMEQYNEDVKLGKILDESSYSKNEKHISIDGVINIDFVKNFEILHEVKKSRKIEEAGVWQVKYYLYYLKKKGVNISKGQIDYPVIKRTLTVELEDKDEKVLEEITQIVESESAPDCYEKNICKKCAYYDLCYV